MSYFDKDSDEFIETDAEKLDDFQLAFYATLKSMREYGILDEDGLEKDGIESKVIDLMISAIEDRKLSTEKRNKLKSSSFCGPNRSFPAHDCPHVRAGFRLLNRAKVSSDTKTRIRSCLNRKNKTMKCGVESSDSMTPMMKLIAFGPDKS